MNFYTRPFFFHTKTRVQMLLGRESSPTNQNTFNWDPIAILSSIPVADSEVRSPGGFHSQK